MSSKWAIGLALGALSLSAAERVKPVKVAFFCDPRGASQTLTAAKEEAALRNLPFFLVFGKDH